MAHLGTFYDSGHSAALACDQVQDMKSQTSNFTTITDNKHTQIKKDRQTERERWQTGRQIWKEQMLTRLLLAVSPPPPPLFFLFLSPSKKAISNIGNKSLEVCTVLEMNPQN
jgi:hypothetical protein